MQILRKIAFPFSLLYFLVVYLRNLCYDFKFFKSNVFKTPTICIGNLSVGGTGKTPMIIYLIELLQHDYKIAVLSRGYKRKTKGFLLATENVTVQDLGDEPYQIYTKYTNISLAVDSDRSNGIKILERIVKPDLILLDDAFQHRKVRPSLSILLTTFSKPYYNDWYLPTGDLRDSIKESARAAIIIITKCPENSSKNEHDQIIKQIKPKAYQKVLFSKISYSNLLIGEDKEMTLIDLKEKDFSLVTGIANPKPLVDYLKSKNLTFKHYNYPDHYFFKENDFTKFSKHELIITTEKDYTKLKGKLDNIMYLEIKHTFLNNDELELKSTIVNVIKDY